MKWTQENLAEIAALQEKHSLTRKSAIQRFRRALKANTIPAPAAAPAQTAEATAPAPQPAKLAKKAKKKPADRPASNEIPNRVAPTTPVSLQLVAGLKVHTAKIQGRKAVVIFQERNREEASHRFDGVALSETRMEACKKFAKAESLPLYMALAVRVGGKLDQGYLVTYELWKKLTNPAGDFMLSAPARLAYAEGGMVGVRFEIAKA